MMRNHLKNFCLTLICFIFFIPGGSAQRSPGQIQLPGQTNHIHFKWQGDSVHSAWEPFAAILIPVKLPHCPKQFYMQFDLGAPYSLFYKNKLMAIQSKYPSAIQLTDSSAALANYTFTADQLPILATTIAIKQFENTAINWHEKKPVEIIGTIGADLIDGRTLIINYPKKELVITNTIPAKLQSGVMLADFFYTGGRVLLPAMINGRQTICYFDTGSSMYELLTDKKTSSLLAVPGTVPVQYKVSSWGKELTANTFVTNDSIIFAAQKLPLKRVTYIDGVSNPQVEQMMKMGIGGMIGNKLFVDFILVLDTKNKKFGITR